MIKAVNSAGYTAVFDPDAHTYTVLETGAPQSSVTTFISSFFPQFDTEYWSKKKSAQLGITQASLKKKWADKAEKAQDIGTLMHLYAERRLRNEPAPDPTCKRSEKLFLRIDQSLAQLSRFFNFVQSEMIVFSPGLGLAGTVDLIMEYKDSGNLAILDFKQNEKIKKTNPWENGFPPVAHMESCDIVKYALQLGFYKKIIEHEGYFPGRKVSNLGLIHLVEDAQPVNIPVKYWEKEIGDMIDHGRRTEKGPAGLD